jgi:general secretion pathway protein L
MKTSPTDSAGSGVSLLVSVDEAGMPGPWRLLNGSGVTERSEDIAALPLAERPARVVLEMPGDQVAVHWLELADGLAPAQAAAAARLMLADASAEPLSRMHVAVGRPESGLTPVALVPVEVMSNWLDLAAAAGLDPDAVVPAPLLLESPAAGFRRRERGDVADYRGLAAAFTLEPELAEALVGDAPVEAVDEPRFEAGLVPIVAAPPINLRQGQFARRRQWKLEGGRLRRIAILAIALVALTLVVQVATILAYTFAADRLETEAETLAAGTPGPGADIGPGFGPVAAVLFDSVRATPNVEMTRLEYRADGSLGATVMLDSPATFTALRSRLEASGLRVEPGEMRSAGGRPTADLTVRAA